MAKSFKKNPLDNLNQTNSPEVPSNENLTESGSLAQDSASQETVPVPPPKDIKKKYLRLDITNYQDYISLMADHKTSTSGEYVSMTQYILWLIEADKQKNMELYGKLEEIEKTADIHKAKEYFDIKSVLSVRGKLHTELKTFVEEQKAEPLD